MSQVENDIKEINKNLAEKEKTIQQLTDDTEKQGGSISELKQINEIIRRKCAALELRQDSLAKTLEKLTNTDSEENARQKAAAVLIMEEARDHVNKLAKEKDIIRKEFNSLKEAFEMEFNILQNENGMILKEYERIYMNNRDLETSSIRLQDGYKRILMTMQRQDINTLTRKTIIDMNSSLVIPEATKLDTTRRNNDDSDIGQSSTIGQSETKQKNLHIRRISNIVGRERKRIKSRREVSTDLGGAIPAHSTRNSNVIEVSLQNMLQESGQARTLGGSVLKNPSEQIALNRLTYLK